jgi:two-component system CheB/CheR fusion protein
VKKGIREMVVFAIQNVIKDPPFTKLDLLSCRNLLIYLEPELQNRLIPAFHYALKPGGVLFLSPSESIGNHTELFSPVSRKWKFYRATPSTTATRAMMSSPLIWTAESDASASEEMQKRTKETNFSELTRRVLVQCFSPPLGGHQPQGRYPLRAWRYRQIPAPGARPRQPQRHRNGA